MPGVGKGTYAKILSRIMDIEHVSAGDLVREEIGRKSDLGGKMQNIVNSGQLLPDEMVVDAVIKKITMPKTKASERGFLLDGFPRTIAQAERLSETVPVDVVLNFTLEEAILVEKACARRRYDCVTACVESHHWFWGIPEFFKNPYRRQIELVSHDSWTVRIRSPSSRRLEREPPKIRSGTLKLKVS